MAVFHASRNGQVDPPAADVHYEVSVGGLVGMAGRGRAADAESAHLLCVLLLCRVVECAGLGNRGKPSLIFLENPNNSTSQETTMQLRKRGRVYSIYMPLRCWVHGRAQVGCSGLFDC
jgi:hypothetical protein